MQSSMLAHVAHPAFLVAVAALTVGYVAAQIVYRRFFHPLAKTPGPFLPAVTTLYQSYYNSRYYLEIERLHKKYGPIVRIQPNEVHLSDQQHFETIYHVGSKYTKSPVYYGALCIPNSTHATASNEIHKRKRARLNPMFSRKMVLELEDVVHDKANKVIALTRAGIAAKQPVDLHHAFRCVSVDVITEYAFDKSYDLLDSPDLGAHFFRMVRGLGPAMYFFQQFPLMRDVTLKIPPSVAYYMGGAMRQVTTLQMEAVKQLSDVKARMNTGKLGTTRPTIFSELLDPEKQDGWPVPPAHELKDEVYSILAAAADTTGNAMTVACYKVIGNREIYSALRKELHAAFPDPDAKLNFVTLERLPYLTGVVKESLRLSFGVPGRLPRVVPQPGATFNGHFLPAGTIVSMSSWIMQRNEEIFPDAMKFDPTRWLDLVAYRRLDNHMMPFGGGSRVCVGMPLAYAELYITLGVFFHRFGNLKVHETTDEDMVFEDFFSSYQIEGKKWFKAVAAET